MKKARKICALLGVLLVICVAAFVISRQEEEKENIRNSDAVILAIDGESVTALSWEYGETSLAFHKDGKWLYDEDEAFPVNEEKIGDLLEQFAEFAVSFEIEDVEDISQYGLDSPVCTIRIAAGEQEYEILLGTYSTMDEERYVSIGDGKVYLVSHDPLENYEVELRDMIKHDEIPGLSDATAIQFAGTQNYEILYEEESPNTYCPDDVYFTEGLPLDSTLVNAYLNTVDGVGLNEYVSYNVTEEKLAEYGLDNPDLTITVNYPVETEEGETVTETFVLYLGRNKEELEAALKTEDENEIYSVSAYARVGDSPIVYEITSLEYRNLTKNSYQDLRHKEVLTASFEDIYQIDITLEGVDHTFTSAETEDGNAIWHYREDEELNISSLKSAISAIAAADAESFTEEDPAGKEEISFTVYLNQENHPQIKVQLYRYDGEDCLAVVDGKTVSRVPRSEVVDLMEEVNSIILN